MVFHVRMCLYIADDVPGLQENSKIQNLNFVKIRNWTQYLVVFSVTKRLIPLDHIGLLFSAQIWKYKLEQISSCQLYQFSCFGAELGFFIIDLVKIFIKISNTYLSSENLSETIFKGADQFAHIFRSWIPILRKLLNFERLYIS